MEQKLSKLQRILAKKMLISIQKDEIVFIKRKNIIKLKTIISIDKNAEKIVSVGSIENKEFDGNIEHVRLFDNKYKIPEIEIFTKYDCLISFIKYGMVQLVSRGIIFPIIVEVENIESLTEIFNGYEKGVFQDVLKQAGVSECVFL